MARRATQQKDQGPAKKRARISDDRSSKKKDEPKFRVKGSPRPGALKTSRINVEEPPRKYKGKGKAVDIGQEEEEAVTFTPKSSPKKAKSKTKTKPQDTEEPPTPLPKSFKIIAGSYEKLLYGLEGIINLDESSDSGYKFDIKPIFIFPAHVSCIKAVAASPQGGKWLATGSSDEIIKVWDLRRRKEIGGLMHHEGSITSLTFPSRSHLISTSEDGTLCLFHARDWSVLRTLKGHKGRVNSVAVHPSGKVGLSVGRDRMLRMWDLMRGRGVASTKLGKEGEVVRWSTTGDMFVVQSGSALDIYATDMKLLHSITHPSRIQDARFFKASDSDEELLFVAAEDKKVSIYSIPAIGTQVEDGPKPHIFAALIGHTNRVKAVQTLVVALPTPSSPGEPVPSTTVITTVSSDGKIHVYDSRAIPPPPKKNGGHVVEIAPAAVYDTEGTRLTCLTLADGDIEGTGDSVPAEKRKRSDDDDDEESEGDDGQDSDGENGEDSEDGEESEEEEWGGVVEDEEEEEDEAEMEED